MMMTEMTQQITFLLQGTPERDREMGLMFTFYCPHSDLVFGLRADAGKSNPYSTIFLLFQIKRKGDARGLGYCIISSFHNTNHNLE